MRFVKWSTAGLLLLILAAGAALLWYAQAVQPTVDGTLRAPGLSAPVDVVRDAEGIPHVYAAAIPDAYFALGWVHAQDRLWQMEFQRRVTAGRLSEILGDGALGTDRFLRTVGIRRAAEAAWSRLDSETKALHESYAAGVNAWLATRTAPLPPEFLILGAPAPEPWSPLDSIGWSLMMAWDLGDNWSDELLRMQLVQRGMPRERIDEFLPNYLGAEFPVKPDYSALYAGILAPAPHKAAALPVPSNAGSGIGSNDWVLSGSRTVGGKPLLANDPHLRLAAPALWYFANLNAPGLSVVGATLPGMPGVILGRNARVAWGFTNTGPDVQDLFIEKVDPADPGRYLTPAGSEPFEAVEERIRVKDAADVVLQVRITRHGPVVSDGALAAAAELLQPGYAMAFAWTALDPSNTTPAAAHRLATATSVADFMVKAEAFKAPQQNIVVADVYGAIGYVAPGLVPVRKHENDVMGLAPVPGWTDRYDWIGWIPYDRLPREVDPARGYRHTANERIVPDDYAPFLRYDFDMPYRADRIRAAIEATPKHDLASTRAIQADTLSPSLAEMLPRMLAIPGRTEAEKAVLEQLRAFDFDMRTDRWEPLVAIAWMRELTRLVYADELGDLFERTWQNRTEFMRGVLSDRRGMSRWCDDVRTPAAETCDDRIADAFTAALADLGRRYGADRTKWSFGAVHVARSDHNPFSNVPVLADLFGIRVPVGGDRHSVNVAWNDFADEAEPYAVIRGPSLRAVYDLADPEKSVFISSTGQSGIVFSRLYANFAARWAAVDYVPMLTKRESVEPGALGTLRLEP